MTKFFDETGERMVGELLNGTFKKRASKAIHFLQKPPAICIEQKVFDAFGFDCKLIEVETTDSRELWRTSYNMFDAKKFVVQRGKFAPQYGLALDRWDVYDPEGELTQLHLSDKKKEDVLDEKAQREKIEWLISKFRPEIGNMNHIRLVKDLEKYKSAWAFFDKYPDRPNRPKHRDAYRLGESIIHQMEITP